MSVREKSADDTEQAMRDIEAGRNEETNSILQVYLERRTACVDELMRRELYAVREKAAQMKAAIAAVLAARASAAQAASMKN